MDEYKHYLFHVHIGPVQSFIASSRRTRDLWFGSELLSKLAKKAAEIIAKECGLESLIFPAQSNGQQSEDANKRKGPNKIYALIDASKQSPEDLGKKIRDDLRKLLDDVAEKVLEVIPADQKIGEYTCREVAKQQIHDFVECFWVAVPYDDKKGDYVNRRRQLDRLMAARKNLRDFQHATWSSEQPKSSIDGQLESVIPHNYPDKTNSKREKNPQAQANRIAQLYQTFHAGAHERLSGVDLLKRPKRSWHPLIWIYRQQYQ